MFTLHLEPMYSSANTGMLNSAKMCTSRNHAASLGSNLLRKTDGIELYCDLHWLSDWLCLYIYITTLSKYGNIYRYTTQHKRYITLSCTDIPFYDTHNTCLAKHFLVLLIHTQLRYKGEYIMSTYCFMLLTRCSCRCLKKYLLIIYTNHRL